MEWIHDGLSMKIPIKNALNGDTICFKENDICYEIERKSVQKKGNILNTSI